MNQLVKTNISKVVPIGLFFYLKCSCRKIRQKQKDLSEILVNKISREQCNLET